MKIKTMTRENEQILTAIESLSQSLRSELQTELQSFKTEMQIEFQSFKAEVQTEVQLIRADRLATDESLKAEVKRWDDRFFKFAEDSTNRSNTLIASATISVIAGVVLILLRQ